MKGMKNRVLAFTLALLMVIANVMTVAATEGPAEEKYVGFEVDGYGGTFGQQHWDGTQWVSDGQTGSVCSSLKVSDGSLRNAELWIVETDPKKEGATFEGWAKFYYQATDTDMHKIFEPKNATEPYYTTDEMLDAKIPEQDVIYAAKWSDIDIEDYYPTYYETIFNANGGKLTYTYCGMGDEDGAIIDEFETTAQTFWQTARKSVSEMFKENETDLIGINKPDEILESWTLYQIDKMDYAFCGEEDEAPKAAENQIVLHYRTEIWEDGAKEYVYLIIEGYKKVADNVSTEELLNSYKGANYYAVANWKKSVELVEDKEVTQTLSKETESIIDKIKKNDASVQDALSQDALDFIGEIILNNLDKTVKTELAVCPVQETMVDKEEKATILAETEKVLGKDAKIQYLDIQVRLTVDDSKIGNLLKLQNKINITIAIPDDMKVEDGKYVVLRNHNGKVDVLETKRNGDGTVSFETDRFSTYALAYVPTKSAAAPETPATPAPVAPKTGDASAIGLYSAVCILALAVVVWKRKEFFVK